MNYPTNNVNVTEEHEQYIYQLRDLVFGKSSQEFQNEYDALGVENTPLNIRTNILEWSHPSSDINAILTDNIVIELWQSHICSKYFGEDIAMSDMKMVNKSAYEFNYIFGEFWRLFENKLISTYQRYKKLIEIYKSQEKDLMKQLESSVVTRSRDNETPQSKDIDPYDTQFTNHSSTGDVTTKTDTETIPQKLEEIHRMWYSLYEEWADQFGDLFFTKY